MDGTLVDTEPLWLGAARDVAAARGHTLTDDEGAQVLGRTSADTAAYLARLCAAPDAAPDDPATLESALEQLFLTAVETRAQVLPGVRDLLGTLTALDVPAALVSASSRPVVDTVLKTLGGNPFRTTVAAGETVRSKPWPDPYAEAASRLGVPPEACLVVEDSPTGVAAAEAAGCRVALAPSPASPAAAPGRRLLTALADLTADWRPART
ncbi:HAD family hydrolase [Streptomyces sp. SPB78]|uniref:HAD family hydrolase n=2 Tax=Streptomyces TaxID=1883 RepID=UPI003B63A87C